MKTVTFRIPDVLKSQVSGEAKARGVSVTSFVREALEWGVIRSARRRHSLEGAKDAIDLTKEDD